MSASESSAPGAWEDRPKLRPDVEVWPLFDEREGRERTFIVGSRALNRYLTIPASKLALVNEVLALLDGEHDLGQIEVQVAGRQGKRVDAGHLCRLLADNGLLAGQSPESVKKGHFERYSWRLLKLSTEAPFAAVERLGLGWIPWAAWGALAVILFGSLAAARRPDLFGLVAERLGASASRPVDWGLSLGLLLLTIAGHEGAHGLVATRHGLRPRCLEAGLYLGFIPMLFLRIPGLYTLKPSARLQVWSAGIFWNVTLASACVLATAGAGLPGRWGSALLLLAVMNYSIAVFNLVPFLPTDGYFLFSTLLGRHNVRGDAWRELVRWVSGGDHRFSGVLVFYVLGVLGSLGWALARQLGRIRHGTGAGAWGAWLSLALLAVSMTVLLTPAIRQARTARAKRGRNPGLGG